MPIFAFSGGLRRATLQCPYDSTAPYDRTDYRTSALQLLGIFVGVNIFVNFSCSVYFNRFKWNDGTIATCTTTQAHSCVGNKKIANHFYRPFL